MQFATVVGLIYKEQSYQHFLITGLLSISVGLIIVATKPKNATMYVKDGFAATTLSWILLSLVGAIPLYYSDAINKYFDAFFECVAGFTTTGATIINDVETLDYCILFWRSFTQFLGGMGVIVFLLAIVPHLGGNQSINLMKAELSGPSVGKNMPKLRTYAALLYIIYVGLTLIEFVLLLLGGMNVFDALTTAFSTAGTGGLSTYNASMGYFESHYLQTVVAVFMMLFGVSFYVYVLLLTKKFKQILKAEELWLYFSIIAVSTIALAINLKSVYGTYSESLHEGFFYTTSIISSTGYAISDTNAWPGFSKALILILTCIGSCAGSTGGGFKVSRILILFKEMKREFLQLLHPHNVYTVKLNGKKISKDIISSTSVYLYIYILIIIASTLLISLSGHDFMTSITGVIYTINNTAPAIASVGDVANYSDFGIFSKAVLCFNMLVGRLELYPMLLLFFPSMWKKN